MKSIKKLICLITLVLSLLLTSCFISGEYIDITNGDTLTVEVGESIQLDIDISSGILDDIEWVSSSDVVTVDDGYITALKTGTTTITASSDEYFDSIIIEVILASDTSLQLFADTDKVEVGGTALLEVIVLPSGEAIDVEYSIISGDDIASISGNVLTGNKVGTVVVKATMEGYTSNELILEILETTDSYVGMSKDDFYEDYEEATSYMDAYYRSLHGFMSGDISKQDQEPTINDNRPTSNGMFIKNSNGIYSSDKNTYFVINEKGEVVNTIYKGGAYVTLEDVAAYVLAFSDIPANYTSSKSGNPKTSPWGEYLRLNHSKFSGDTTKYPYEPELPNITGCGGDLQYFEIDLGTTGTDCDPKYTVEDYNNGSKITRGAARIVYSRFDRSGKLIEDIEERYVFYTYNHYNDFQEYLNYEYGWGEMFGNITGGGTISSKTNCNPTPYVPVVLENLVMSKTSLKYQKKTIDAMFVTYKREEELYLEF